MLYGDLFATASITALVCTLVFGFGTPARARRRTGALRGFLRIAARAIVIALALVAAPFFVWVVLDHVSEAVPITAGAVLGYMAAVLIRTLFAKDPQSKPLLLASAIGLLVVVFAFPVYRSEFSNLLQGGGASIKTPVGLELSFAGGLASRPVFHLGSNDLEPAGTLGLPDSSSVLDALANKFGGTPNDDDIDIDSKYLNAMKTQFGRENPDDIDKVSLNGLRNYIFVTASCLKESIGESKDPRILMATVRPILERFFGWQNEADSVGFASVPIMAIATDIGHGIKCGYPPWALAAVDENGIRLSAFQPYFAIAFADLLRASGAHKEAVAVLVRWLDRWKKFEDSEGKPPASEWFRFRVENDLELDLSEVVGQNDPAYRRMVRRYADDFNAYAAKLDTRLSLNSLAGKCADLTGEPRPVPDAKSSWTKQYLETRLSYLLIANEDEQLRVERYFLGEQDFAALDVLASRASQLVEIANACLVLYLPKRAADDQLADVRLTAGLLDLGLADRMAEIAGPWKAKRSRAQFVCHKGEDMIGQGLAHFKNYRDHLLGETWYDLLFKQGPYTAHIEQAKRVQLQRTEEELNCDLL